MKCPAGWPPGARADKKRQFTVARSPEEGVPAAIRGQPLIARRLRNPVLFLNGRGDIPMVVAALHEGTFDFLEKPHCDNALETCAMRVRSSRPQALTSFPRRRESSLCEPERRPQPDHRREYRSPPPRPQALTSAQRQSRRCYIARVHSFAP